MVTQTLTSTPQSQMSMGLELVVSLGRAQVQRNTGRFRQLYRVDENSVTSRWIELNAGQEFSSNPNEMVQQLVICCTGPLILTLNNGVSEFQLPVTKMAVIDSPHRGFKLKNGGLTAVRCDINMVTTLVE